MPLNRPLLIGAPGEVGGAASTSCLRWFAIFSNFFDVEMSLEEKVAWQALRRLAATPFSRGNPQHEEVS